MKTTNNVIWKKFPEEEPENEGDDIVIALVKKNGDTVTIIQMFAEWFIIPESDNRKDNWSCQRANKLPDSFYWLQLPEIPL